MQCFKKETLHHTNQLLRKSFYFMNTADLNVTAGKNYLKDVFAAFLNEFGMKLNANISTEASCLCTGKLVTVRTE